MAKTVGLYLGVNSLGVAVASGRTLVSLSEFAFSGSGDQEGVADEDVRLEALINKAIRESGTDVEEVYLSLADRDFIFRSLEIPLMRKTEVESSLVYEVEKFIPFKITELEWTYADVRFPKEKKMGVSFIGIRESNLERIREILSRLGLKATFIEPSSLSLIRTLKSVRRFSKLDNFALLDLTEQESHLTFFQNDLPIFNRYLTIPKKAGSFDAAKFSESVDFSFQYFKREFRSYKLDKFILVSDIENQELIKLLSESLQIEVEVVSPADITGHNNARVESVKAFGAAVSEQTPSAFKSSFRKTKVSQEGEMLEVVTEAPAFRVGLLAALLGVGLIANFFISVVMGNEVSLKAREVKNQEEAVAVPKELVGFSWDEYQGVVDKLAADLEKLQTIKSSFNNLSEMFKALSSRRVLPEGLWLEDFRIIHSDQKYAAAVSGCIFRDDDYKERLGLDDFIARLKSDYSIQRIFSNIQIDSSRRQKKKEFEVTCFSITLR